MIENSSDRFGPLYRNLFRNSDILSDDVNCSTKKSAYALQLKRNVAWYIVDNGFIWPDTPIEDP